MPPLHALTVKKKNHGGFSSKKKKQMSKCLKYTEAKTNALAR
jgi:hypothetical protein